VDTKSVKSSIENETQNTGEKPEILEEIVIEELSIDGICGVY
jgi:mycofactocin precursor